MPELYKGQTARPPSFSASGRASPNMGDSKSPVFYISFCWPLHGCSEKIALSLLDSPLKNTWASNRFCTQVQRSPPIFYQSYSRSLEIPVSLTRGLWSLPTENRDFSNNTSENTPIQMYFCSPIRRTSTFSWWYKLETILFWFNFAHLLFFHFTSVR